jgi:WD40 repeat protein
VRLWDVKTGVQIRQLNRNEREVTSVTFSPDGSTIAAGSHDYSLCAWEAASGKELAQFNRDPSSASGGQERPASNP